MTVSYADCLVLCKTTAAVQFDVRLIFSFTTSMQMRSSRLYIFFGVDLCNNFDALHRFMCVAHLGIP